MELGGVEPSRPTHPSKGKAVRRICACGGRLAPHNFDPNHHTAYFKCEKCGEHRSQKKRQPDLRVLKLTSQELRIVQSLVSAQYMTFLGHYMKPGLFDHEVDEANRLGALMHKLGPSKEPHAPLPYLGTLPSGRRSDGS